MKKTHSWTLVLILISFVIFVKYLSKPHILYEHVFPQKAILKSQEVIKNGKVVEYYDFDKKTIKSIGFYVNGKLDGLYSEYDPLSLRLTIEENYKDGIKNGLSKTFSPIDGSLISEQNYKDGMEDGIEKTYNNGKLMFVTTYKDGEKNGIMKEYYENGILSDEVMMVNDLENGLSQEYYPNGALKQKGFYSGGKLEGTARVFYEDGKLKDLGNFKNGKKEGVWKRFDESGALAGETPWHEDKENGAIKIYKDVIPYNKIISEFYKNVPLREEIDFKDGDVKGAKIYDDKDNLIENIVYIGQDRSIDRVYIPYDADTHQNLPKPALFLEINYKNEVEEGVTNVYRADGIVSVKWNYHNGKPDGITKVYYDSTVMQYQDTYKDGVKINRKAYC